MIVQEDLNKDDPWNTMWKQSQNNLVLIILVHPKEYLSLESRVNFFLKSCQNDPMNSEI